MTNGTDKVKPMPLAEALKACPYPLEIPPRSKERGREINLADGRRDDG